MPALFIFLSSSTPSVFPIPASPEWPPLPVVASCWKPACSVLLAVSSPWRGELIDDCALAKRVQVTGYKTMDRHYAFCAESPALQSSGGIWNMGSPSAFTPTSLLLSLTVYLYSHNDNCVLVAVIGLVFFPATMAKAFQLLFGGHDG